MTGLLLWILGITTTGLTYPNYEGIQSIQYTMDQVKQQEQQIKEEQQANYLAEQEKIIIDDYFLFLNKIGKIKYARGCMGEYTPARRSEEKQKYVKCSDKAYDCAGLIKGYAVAKGILGSKEAAYYNSQSLMSLAKPKDAKTAQRGDRTSRQGYGERSTGNLSTHFAIVSRDYSGGGTLWIYDNVNGPNNNIVAERPIKVAYSHGMFHYLGKYRISVYSNGLVETAKEKGIQVTPREDMDQGRSDESDPTNPNNRDITIKGYPYDSDANRIANYRYKNSSGDIKMISKFMAEAHFNLNAVGKHGEKGICQLMPNRTNNVRIKNPARNSGREYQAKICLEKYQAVPNPDKVRHANGNNEIPNILYLK